MPRLNNSHSPASRKFALLLIIAVLMNCLGLTSFAARAPHAPAPTPAQTDSVRVISLTTNDIVYNKTDKTLYASVPSSVGQGGNSIMPINPVTGAPGTPVFIGSEPNKLALSDDGQTLYAALDGADAVRRFDLTTKTPGQQFAVNQDSLFGPFAANDIAVAPGNPNRVAIARYYKDSKAKAAVAIYD